MSALTRARPRVFVVLKSDGVGGVERLAVSVVDLLAGHGIHADLVTLAPSTNGPGILAGRSVSVLDARGGPTTMQRVRQRRALRRLIAQRRPDAVLSFGPSPNAVAALARGRRGPRTVIAEVGDPFIERRRRWNRSWMWTYRRADALVLQTERLAAEVRPLRSRPAELRVISNVLAPHVPFADPDRPRRHVIAGVGRFSPGKRYGDLLTAFAALGDAAAGWRLLLVGDGEERERWATEAERLGIAAQVTMPGFHDAPWELLADAEVFVLCSAHEGFPTVLLEAMASGCAVVASDCRFGPRDVLAAPTGRTVSGLLYPVGDVEALTAHLQHLVADPEARRHLAGAALDRVRDYTPDVLAPEWLGVLGLDRPDQGRFEPGHV